MTFHIITIFPQIFNSYLEEGILSRAQKNNLIKINILNLRDFSSDKHKTVDDRPFGGGPGMVLKVEPIYKAVQFLKSKSLASPKFSSPSANKIKSQKSKIILLSAKGKRFNQNLAYKFSKFKEIVFICGRYEGVDERVTKYIADEEISIGDYILSGGELAALVIIEAISRLIPGVLGNIESIEEKRFNNSQPKGGWPVYTRPAVFEPKPGVKWNVPKILLSGNHKKIDDWKKRASFRS